MSSSTPQTPRRPPLACSFCDAPQAKVKKLIAGPECWICNDCVVLCDETMQADDAPLPAPPPSELLRRLDEAMPGRRAAKRATVAALRMRELVPDDAESRATRLLIVGARGTGKTFFGRAAARTMGGASYAGDAGRLSESGYVGDDVENLVYGVLRAAHHNAVRAARGFLFIDSLEKLRGRPPIAPNVRDINGAGVQRELLRLLEGEVLGIAPGGGARHPQQTFTDVDTSRIVVVAAFRPETWSPEGMTESQLRDALTRDGLIDAVVERFHRVVPLSPLGEDELAAILRWAGGPLDEANAVIKRLGGSLELDAATLAAMARAAAATGDGAWALSRVVRRMLDEILLAHTPARHWRFAVDDVARWT
ncbi:MAG: ClpX C4-type zinc finger protein [Polyangiaceae bacterium]